MKHEPDFTREEALRWTRKMFLWIAEKSKERKKKVQKVDYFFETQLYARPVLQCFLCEYSGMECKNCPVSKWANLASQNYSIPCRNAYADSPYARFCDASTWEEYSDAAEKVAELMDQELKKCQK